MIPELDLARIRRWVDARNSELPERAQGLIHRKAGYTGLNITITHDEAPHHEYHFFSSDTSTRVMHRRTNSRFKCLNSTGWYALRIK